MELQVSPSETQPVRPFRAEQVPFPRGWSSVEWPNGPVEIEIGCGVGMHPIRYAMAHPDRTLFAIEHTVERFQSFQRRYENHKRPENLIPVHADAVEWVTHFVPAASVQRFFILYPNPWPRPGDERRRWYRLPFFGRLLETLVPGGEVLLATNLEDYAQGAARWFTEAWGLQVEVTPATGPARTHFERKYLERGEKCWNTRGKKKTDRS